MNIPRELLNVRLQIGLDVRLTGKSVCKKLKGAELLGTTVPH
jgi:hypothetical protein